eukprot:gnl/Hemi2/9482_TR3295_c0_g1_i1.p1 gnl/Hemi2/9482_TR3295_c0_g1~~gnl/Hemi2/9482_TR3295_c0_g1_i1.p1  ORF type:complete len:666 (-),score=194.75 gnl/Hemi2/9482_TR3295_c0_g1_i1:129-1919(-)
MNELFGEPAHGCDKELNFTYQVLGCISNESFQSKVEVVPLTALFYRTTQKYPIKQMTDNFILEILSAFYGPLGGQAQDVTQIIKCLVTGSGANATISSSVSHIADVLADRETMGKVLFLSYRWVSRSICVTYPEDEKIDIDYEDLWTTLAYNKQCPMPFTMGPPQVEIVSYVAQFDYTAPEVTDPNCMRLLSFKAGDLIIHVAKVHDGWWQGECNGLVGLFPSNYVEPLDPSKVSLALDPALASSSQRKASSDNTLHHTATSSPRPRGSSNTATTHATTDHHQHHADPRHTADAAAESAEEGDLLSPLPSSSSVHKFQGVHGEDEIVVPDTSLPVLERKPSSTKKFVPTPSMIVALTPTSEMSAFDKRMSIEIERAKRSSCVPPPVPEFDPQDIMSRVRSSSIGLSPAPSSKPGSRSGSFADSNIRSRSRGGSAAFLVMQQEDAEQGRKPSIAEEPPAVWNRCRVLFDYAAETEFELSIAAGDVLSILWEKEGWYMGYKGEDETQQGFFPCSYVEIITDETENAIKELTARARAHSHAVKIAKKANVLFEFTGDSELHLPLRMGDVITIVCEKNGWGMGTNIEGARGIFPLNYVAA